MTDMPEQSAELDRGAYEERRHQTKYSKRPHCVYFYYLYPEDGTYKFRHYYSDNEVAVRRRDLEDIATNLALNARLPVSAQAPQPNATSWDEVEWQRVSYLIVLVDDPTYEMAKNEGIKFDYVGGGGNHTFFDAKDLDIDLPRQQGGIGTERVSAVACLNHMKKDADGDEELPAGEPQKFSFKLNPELEPRFYPDDGGTNLGPPVPPPS